MISFSALTKSAYDALETKVQDRLYFLTDTGELFLNNVQYGYDEFLQQQADYAESDSTAVDYIKNKPDLNIYVEKVEGKGLSTNDFTNEDKDKLDGIAAGAEVNVQADWDESDSTADSFIKGKAAVSDALTALQNALTFQNN